MSIELELAHYGVKGMKWGTRRRDRRAGRKAAKNHIKMVNPYSIRSVYKRLEYGEVGNKLVEAHKAFDHHVANTDWEKRGKEARSKRARANVAKGTGKAARGAKNVALGNYRNVGVGILATAAGIKI